MVLLMARSISVVFGSGDARHAAVDDVSLDVSAGECVGIVGESGSGKSTLARVLVGLQRPTDGKVVLEGAIVVDRGGIRFAKSERRKVQMIFQDPYDALNPRMRAVAAVAEAIHFWRALRPSVARLEAYRLLESIGIPKVQADLYPGQLSGGQRQRISVARALAPEPQLLIADEPTSSIDQSAQAQLLNALRHLRRDKKLAIVFISHDLSLVGYLSSRVLVMRGGKIVEEGSTQAVLSEPTHAYTRALLASVPGNRSRVASGVRPGR